MSITFGRLARRSLIAAGLVVGLLGASAARSAETIRAIGPADTQASVGAAMERFARELQTETQGRAQVTLDPAAASGNAALEAVRRGDAVLGWLRLAEIGNVAPEVATLTVPFLFADQQKALELLDATWLGPLLNDQFRKQNLEPLGFMNAGDLRLAGQTMPSLDAVQGQRIAARPGELRAAAFKALGMELLAGSPQPEQMLQSPLVELRTDDLAAVNAGQTKFALIETPHAHDLVVLVANRERFEALPLDIQETVRNRLQETASWQRGATSQADAVALTNLRQQGIEIAPLPEEQRRQAHERVKAAIAEALKHADQNILRTLLAYAD